MNKFFPPKLKTGDTIGLFSSSSSVNEFDKTRIKIMDSYLAKIGLKTYWHPSCFHADRYLVGSPQKRVTALHDLLNNPNIKGLLSFWGGTNTNNILDYLDFDIVKRNPKPIIGYSDTTCLLQTITNMTGLITYYGAAGITFTKPAPVNFSLNQLKLVCFNNNQAEWLTLKEPTEYADDLFFLNNDPTKRTIKPNSGLKIYRTGSAKGELVIGHLFSLLNMIQTPYATNFKNKILFIEEAEDFTTPMIHRFFTQLKQVGILNEIKGLVIGKFMETSKVSNSDLKYILNEVLVKVDIPVIYNASFGHTDPVYTLPNGSLVDLNTNRGNIIKVKIS